MAGMSHVTSSEGWDPSDLAMDRISSLPWNVLDIILAKLPILDAVRTSVLAKDWRYKWLSVSEFVLDTDGLTLSLNKVERKWGTVASIVNNYLLNHTETIKMFALRTYCSSHYPVFYQWIQFLSKQDVEVFFLEVFGEECFEIPSHLFSFEKLKALFLRSCILRIPCTFGRFSSLCELLLRNVSISDEALENLILACPSLEKLTLYKICGLKHLKIHAQRLTGLLVDTGFEDIVVNAAPDLAGVSIAAVFRGPGVGTTLN